MKKIHKERLVGITVLAATALIALPVLFGPKPAPTTPFEIHIPQRPDIDIQTPVSQLKEDVIEKHVKPKAIQKIESKSWLIQLATFEQHDNAKQLTAKLVKAGYPAYYKTIQAGHYTTVYVGPYATQKRANTQNDEFKTSFGLEGILIKHDLTEDSANGVG